MDEQFRALLRLVQQMGEQLGIPRERLSTLLEGAPSAPPMADRTPSLWDARDVARFLKVSVSWVYKRSEAGELPHRRIGGLLRFKADEVRDWAERNGRGDSKVIPLKRGG